MQQLLSFQIALGTAMWKLVLILLGVGFGASWLRTGDAYRAVLITATVSPFVLVAGYFSTRGSSPTRSERVFARTWIVVRRLVCFTAAAGIGVFATLLITLGVSLSDFGMAGFGVFLAAVAVIAVRIGLYGASERLSGRGDKAEHEDRKVRYGWK